MPRTIANPNAPETGIGEIPAGYGEVPDADIVNTGAAQSDAEQGSGSILRPAGGRRLPLRMPLSASLPLGQNGRNFPTLPGRGRRIMGVAPGNPPPVTGPQLGAMLSSNGGAPGAAPLPATAAPTLNGAAPASAPVATTAPQSTPNGALSAAAPASQLSSPAPSNGAAPAPAPIATAPSPVLRNGPTTAPALAPTTQPILRNGLINVR